jgi:hypothetical protein
LVHELSNKVKLENMGEEYEQFRRESTRAIKQLEDKVEQLEE